MVDEIEKRKLWIRKLCAIIIGLSITGIILLILPELSKRGKKKEQKKIIKKEVVIVKSIVEPQEEKESEAKVKIAYGSFKKYRITLEVEFKEETEIEKALKDLKKACFIIKSSPTIKKLNPISAKVIGKKDGVDVEYDIELDQK